MQAINETVTLLHSLIKLCKKATNIEYEEALIASRETIVTLREQNVSLREENSYLKAVEEIKSEIKIWT